jgi:MFS superfamily sulfate permease-like transporter
VRHLRGTRPRGLWVGAVLAPLVVGSPFTAAALAAVAGLAVLVLVLMIVAIALGSAFARSAARRRACLHTLQTLLQVAPWTCHGDRKAGILNSTWEPGLVPYYPAKKPFGLPGPDAGHPPYSTGRHGDVP